MGKSWHSWANIIISALAYSLAFIFSDTLWWLSFLFLVPLLYTALTDKLSFQAGFIWAIITFSMQESGIFYSIICLANNAWHALVLVPIALLYQAFLTGLWFWITQHFITLSIFFITTNITAKIFLFTYQYKQVITLSIWIISLWAYFSMFDAYLLAIGNCVEGYSLVYPLLPLAAKPEFLTFLYFFGKNTLLFLLILSSGLICSLYIIQNNYKRIFIFLSACIFWFISWIFYVPNTNIPKWLHTIAYVPQAFYNPNNITKSLKDIQDVLIKLIKKYPEIELVIFPESALFLCDLTQIKQDLILFDSQHIGKAINLLIGALRIDNFKSHNTLYWLYNGTIKTYFDKRHAMILTEKVPLWAQIDIIKNMYYTERPEIWPGTNKRPLFTITDTIELVPYICSELFFSITPDDIYLNKPIVALCNDTWIEVAYVERLMRLVCCFKTIEWNRLCLYVSYTQGFLADSTGKIWLLKK